MSRRRKNEDVYTQLGDPLPLPYSIDGTSSPPSSSKEQRQFVNSDALYKRSDNENLKKLELEIEPEKPRQHRPIKLAQQRPTPIRRRFVKRSKDMELVNNIENELEYVKQLIVDNRASPKELELLNDIQHQLQFHILQESVDTEGVNENGVDNDPEILGHIDDSGDFEIVPQQVPLHQNGHIIQNGDVHTTDETEVHGLSPIMAELEKLQNRINSRDNKSTGWFQIKRILFIIICTIIFLSIPYIFGLSRYDYCYYYC